MERGEILSIRLSPDGLSFWTTSLAVSTTSEAPARPDLWSRGAEKALDFDPSQSLEENLSICADKIMAAEGSYFSTVEIFPDTLRCVTVPEELLVDGCDAGYFPVNGITLNNHETILRAEIFPGIISLIAFETETIRALNEIWGRECVVKSPFSVGFSFISKYGAGRRRTATIYLTPRNLYISVFEKRSGNVLYMDALKWTTEADVLYAVSLLDREFGLKKSMIYIRGTKAEQVHKLFRKYYRKSKCE